METNAAVWVYMPLKDQGLQEIRLEGILLSRSTGSMVLGACYSSYGCALAPQMGLKEGGQFVDLVCAN